MRHSLRAQTRAAARKIEAAIRKGWRPGKGPVCSYGSKRAARAARAARRQEGQL